MSRHTPIKTIKSGLWYRLTDQYAPINWNTGPTGPYDVIEKIYNPQTDTFTFHRHIDCHIDTTWDKDDNMVSCWREPSSDKLLGRVVAVSFLTDPELIVERDAMSDIQEPLT
jgi:hypothetical protein